jgi:tetratricopeptide (TPR) repeat protein
MAKKKATPPQEPPLPPGVAELLKQHSFDSVFEMVNFMQQVMSLLEPEIGGLPMPMFGMNSFGEMNDDLYKAQQLVFEAMESPSKTRRIKLAKQALSISEDCADAYTILGDYAPNREAALILYNQALAASTRIFHPEEFEEMKGHFWGIMETRPYMRARLEVALALLDMGRLDEARSHMEAMLELNPNDNQGIRYILLALLFRIDDMAGVQRLFKHYPDDWMAEWHYGKALHSFYTKGIGKDTSKLLKTAVENNPHVPAYLLKQKQLPKHEHEYITPGAANEAENYTLIWLPIWEATPGALDWLMQQVKS